MAGHSKWANIKHRKARQDASRGKIWTKVIREITVAAKDGPDPADNPRLRLALEKANSANMPKDTIKRAIEKGSGTGETGVLEEITFEGYGPGGVAILVETMTDNRNRTVSDVRHAFSKYGGNLGTDGSVSYLFKKLGIVQVDKNFTEEELISSFSPLSFSSSMTEVYDLLIFLVGDQLGPFKSFKTSFSSSLNPSKNSLHPSGKDFGSDK